MEPPLDFPERPVQRGPTPRIRTVFWALFALTLAVKLVLAASVPVLGDEAYFFEWGSNVALGYYDHPPLVGWLLAASMVFGRSLPWLRLPSVLLSSLMALGAVALLVRHGGGIGSSTSPDLEAGRDAADRAYLVGMLLLLLPIHLVGVFTLTDTPLVLFSFASGAALIRAVEDDDLRWYAASGLALGLAFLAKYLAVLLAAGYLVWWLGSARMPGDGRARVGRRTLGFVLLVATAAPFALFNLGWNATHCWTNVLFNLYSRHVGEGHNYSVPRNLLFYVTTHLYMATPLVLWYLVRRWRRLRGALAEPAFRVAVAAFGVPMSLLLLFALTSVFGAYWVLPFYPFLFLLLHRVLDRRELVRAALFLGVFGGVQALVVGAAALAPLEAWQDVGFYRSMVTMERPGELLARLEPFRAGQAAAGAEGKAHLASTGYSLASILSYAGGETVAVLGRGSHYARQDDFLTDFRAWDGERVVVVSKRPFELETYRPWFERLETAELELHGATFPLLVGDGFRFVAYRDEVLDQVRRTYYDVPDWLPVLGCPFCEKYFPEAACGGGEGRAQSARLLATNTTHGTITR